MFLAVSQCPSHFRCIGFSPPAIELREINAAINEHFHAARATGFPGSPGCIDPDIYPLYHLAGEKHVIVTQEDDVRTGVTPSDESCPLLDQGLPLPVIGMGLARHDKLHGALGVREDAEQPFGIM